MGVVELGDELVLLVEVMRVDDFVLLVLCTLIGDWIDERDEGVGGVDVAVG